MPRTLVQNAEYIANTIKPAIKSAIEAQGVTVPSTDSFLDYADRIGEIEGGGSGYQLKDLPTGAISTVNDAAPLPLNALKVSVEAWQEGTGDPSPSNIRPIIGWDSGVVNIESKNAVNLVFANDTNSIVGLDFSHTVSSFTLSGTATGGYRIFQLTNLPKIKIGATYTYSVRVSGTKARCFVGFRFYKNGTEISGGIARANLNDGDLSSISFSLDSDFDAATYVIEGIQANTVFDCTVEVQLEAGDRVTAFTPYVNGKQYTQQFPTTIYGAEWDVVGGGMTEGYGFVDMGSLTYIAGNRNQSDTGRIFYLQSSMFKKSGNVISSAFKNITVISPWEAMQNNCIGLQDEYLVACADYADATAFKTAMQGVQLVYELATPTTIQLSPLSIRLLEDTNNIYADCGEVLEGEYFVDEGAIDVRKVDYQIGSSGSIKTTDGRVLSGFASMSGYHARPLDASGNWLDVDWSKDFEIGVAFKFTAFPTYQSIFGDGNANSYRKAPRIYYDNSEGKLALCVSSDGSTLAIDTYLNHSFVIDKWYFIKAKFVLSTMTFSVDISDDFSTFTSLYSGVMASAPYHDAASLSLGGEAQQSNMASNTFLIDTFNTYIKGDGISWGASTGAFPS